MRKNQVLIYLPHLQKNNICALFDTISVELSFTVWYNNDRKKKFYGLAGISHRFVRW